MYFYAHLNLLFKAYEQMDYVIAILVVTMLFCICFDRQTAG